MMAYRRNHTRVPATAEQLERIEGYDADGNKVRVVAYGVKGHPGQDVSYWMSYQKQGMKSAAYMNGWRTENEQQFTGKTARERFIREMSIARVLLEESVKAHA